MLEIADTEVIQNLHRYGDKFFHRALKELPFHVQVPRTKLDELGKSGPVQTTVSDQRRHVRFRQLKRCVLRCESTFPSIQRTSQLSLGLVVNISKEGVGILHHAQLYPNERFVMRFEGSGLMRLTVARCRKIGPQCYEIGALSIKPIDIKPFI